MSRRRRWRRLAALGLAAFTALALLGERGRPFLPSSRRALRWMGFPRVLDLSIVHVYVYGRWTRLYMGVLRLALPHLGRRSAARLADTYHAKVLTLRQAGAIVRLDRDVPLRDLERVIPYAQARDLMLSGPPEMALYECACRLSKAEHCEPTQVCLVVGQPFVDFVLEHHPGASRRVAPAEALQVLRDEHERGHVHTAWFRAAARGRFYAICNCCPCCCVGLEGMARHGIPLMASSGYVAHIESAACTACGACQDACPFGAVSVVGGTAVVDRGRCLGCSVCVDRCPKKAITLVRDDAKPPPLDVQGLVAGAG